MDKSIDLKEVLRLHERWLKGYADRRRMDLSQADLRGAKLRNADLRWADLSDAGLRGADLCGANLSHTDLHGADLCGANLCDANLCGVNLCGADLCAANLCNTNLSYADLCDADLCDANLGGADLSCATFDDRIFCLDRIGSVKRRTTYNATKDIVWCGCFTGTFKKWVAKIRKTYPDENNVYRKEYEAAIAYFKAIAKASRKKV